MAGIYRTDSEIERDLKFDQWIGKRRYQIVDDDQESYDQNVDLVLVKKPAVRNPAPGDPDYDLPAHTD